MQECGSRTRAHAGEQESAGREALERGEGGRKEETRQREGRRERAAFFLVFYCDEGVNGDPCRSAAWNGVGRKRQEEGEREGEMGGGRQTAARCPNGHAHVHVRLGVRIGNACSSRCAHSLTCSSAQKEGAQQAATFVCGSGRTGRALAAATLSPPPLFRSATASSLAGTAGESQGNVAPDCGQSVRDGKGRGRG